MKILDPYNKKQRKGAATPRGGYHLLRGARKFDGTQVVKHFARVSLIPVIHRRQLLASCFSTLPRFKIRIRSDFYHQRWKEMMGLVFP